ncbi:LbtU family siderophore porin [Verrucomicrobiota bacterium]
MRVRKAQNAGIFWVIVLLMAFMTTTFAEDNTKKPPHLYETPAEKRDVAGIILREGISVGGLIEVEAFAGKEDGETVSDIVLTTFELGIEAELNEWVQGRALLLWEEDGTEPVDLDEAMIVLGGNEAFPAYLKVGKIYVPFGTFNSHFISDPLTLELAETRESAVLAGFASDLLDISAGAFNGDADEHNDKANDVFAALSERTVWDWLIVKDFAIGNFCDRVSSRRI